MLRRLTRHPEGGRLLDIESRAPAVALILASFALIVLLPAPLNAAAVFAPLAALLLLLYPALIPLALVASVPIQDAIPIPEEIPITATRVMAAAAAAILPFVLLRKPDRVRWSRFLGFVLVLMAAMILSLWNAVSLPAGYAELYHWLVAGFVFWLVLQFVTTRRQVKWAIALTGLLALSQGVLGVVQSLVGAGPDSFQIGAGLSRSFGAFGMPNSYAAYMEIVTLPLIPLAIWAAQSLWKRTDDYRRARLKGYLASAVERRELLLAGALFLIVTSGALAGLAGIALSFSRGGWIGALAAIGVMVLLIGRRAVATAVVATGILSLLLLVSAPGAILTDIGDRFTQIVDQIEIGDIRGVPVTDENFAVVERMAHWQTAIEMWDEHPWIGVGAGNYNERFTEFAVHPQFDDSQGHAHNYYLHLLAETGVLGLAAYLGFLAGTVLIGWRAYCSTDPLARAIGIGAIGITVALTFHNVFENLHVLNITLQMMLIWAIALIASRWNSPEALGRSAGNDSDQLLYDSHRANVAQHRDQSDPR